MENSVSQNTNSQGVVPTSGELGKVDSSGIVRKFPEIKRGTSLFLVLASFLVVILGVATGWILSNQTKGSVSKSESSSSTLEKDLSEANAEVDLENLSESVKEIEGILVEGGIEGEGTHHLERPGGPSQNVYLTSTSINLDSFIGKKVHVWGETLSGIKAGWLMDVIKIKELK